MSYTTEGLLYGGATPHYQIYYDNALSAADGLDMANQLIEKCEGDFNLMNYWFNGVDLKFPYPVKVYIGTGQSGASWEDPPGIETFFYTPHVSVIIKAGTGRTINDIRCFLAAEVTEMFMATLMNGWYESNSWLGFGNGDEGSKGEGLSRFLSVQVMVAYGLPAIPADGSTVTSGWLNSPRENFVDNNPDTNQINPTTGCTTAFIYYLHYQLGYSINDIINAGSNNLGEVYEKLTGASASGWSVFIRMVNLHYPQGYTYNPAGDNLFPVSNIMAFNPPPLIEWGDTAMAEIVLDNPAMAEVIVQLKSEDTTLITVPSQVIVPVGSKSVSFPIKAVEMSIVAPAKKVGVIAVYADVILTMTVEVLRREVTSV